MHPLHDYIASQFAERLKGRRMLDNSMAEIAAYCLKKDWETAA